jgi:[protein-PII] uridylyltransferase
MPPTSDELVEQRIASALALVGSDRAQADRITGAPAGYLVALPGNDVARHAGLLATKPAPGEVRVVVTPGRHAGQWHLDVAGRDRPGLLAVCAGVLADRGIDVVQAVLATWDDGTALEAFVVRSTRPPDATALQDAFEASLDRAPRSSPVAGATVTFDPDASDLYTACEVRAPDEPGLLRNIAVAIAAARVDVHAARIETCDGHARNRFDLSDGAAGGGGSGGGGGKVRTEQEAAIRTFLASGVTVPRRSRWAGLVHRRWRS